MLLLIFIMIIIRPALGLANRLRVLNSCIVLHQYNKANFKVVWEENLALNCCFSLLFQPIDCFKIIKSSKALDYFASYAPDSTSNFKGRLKKVKRRAAGIIWGEYYNDLMVKELRFNDDFWLKHLNEKAILDTCHDFFSVSDNHNHYDKFKPVNFLQEKIDKLSSKFQGSVIGIHIRRTDNKYSIEKSTDELFLRRIDEVLLKDSTTLFYLSTDSPEVETFIKSRFGERIISYESKLLDRNHPKGIQDALIDLYTLSKTRQIMGSWWSSFSMVAAELGRIPLNIVR